jgi:fibro-slime domain-containing protein
MKKETRFRTPAGYAVGVMVGFGLLLCLAQGVRAQDFAPRMIVPVTFYDFLSDRSNPEFEQPHMSGRIPGIAGRHPSARSMVESTLDADFKPIARTAEDNVMNQGIRFWFRDWNNLSGYTMSGRAHPMGAARDNGEPNYLRRFRPIYMYSRDASGTNFTTPPPGIRQDIGDNSVYHDHGRWNDRANGGNGAHETGWRSGGTRFRWMRNAYTDAEAVQGQNGSGGVLTVASAYQNSRIPGYLHFDLIDARTGTYQFSVSHTSGGEPWNEHPQRGFFPLSPDNRNFVRDGRVMVSFEPGAPTPLATGWVSSNNNRQVNGHTANWAFTMEMATRFRMERGLTFEFEGDDDLWLFINGHLVQAVDLGGIKEATRGGVNLDTLIGRAPFNLVLDSIYDFRLFYAERHSDMSNIRITTNIVTARLTGMDLVVEGETMTAGVPQPAVGVIRTDIGDEILQDFSGGRFTWTARDIGGGGNNTADGSLTLRNASTAPNKQGTTAGDLSRTDSITVTATRAHTTIRIVGEYFDNHTQTFVRDSVDLPVRPGAPTRLHIERTQDQTASLWRPLTMDTVRITGDFADNFYAILRDEFGNWVSVAGTTGGGIWQGANIEWTLPNSNIATVGPATQGAHGPTRGQGRAERRADAGSATLNVRYLTANNNQSGLNPNLGVWVGPATAVLLIDPVSYNAIEIYVMPNGPGGGTTLRVDGGTVEVPVGSDTTLWVRMRRADNGAWVEAPATWTQSGQLNLTPPGGSVISWTIAPGTDGTGTVTAAVPGNPNVSASVTIVAPSRGAQAMRIYSWRGVPRPGLGEITSHHRMAQFPSESRPYPTGTSTMTLSAGTRLPMNAKMFGNVTADSASWLSQMENPVPGSGLSWTWGFVSGSPTTATLSATSGDTASFISTVAHQTYRIIVRFSGNGGPIEQEIRIRVIPDISTARLHIEPNAQGNSGALLNNSQKIDSLFFSESDQTRNVYAVLRDEFNNFIGFSGGPIEFEYRPSHQNPGPTQWSPPTGTPATVAGGNAILGEGVITKTASSGGVWVHANDQTYNTRDSVWVRILGYDYDRVQIARRCPPGQQGYNGFCIIDGTLEMTTNDDLELFVIGRRNDCGDNPPNEAACWEQVTGNWGRDASLGGALANPPSGTNSWTLSPHSTGTGEVSVVRPGSAGDLRDNINLVITVGPPLRVEMVFITPPEEMIAGQPIRAIVQYYNRVGLLTEWNPAWGAELRTYFADTLGIGNHPTSSHLPTVDSRSNGLENLYHLGNRGQPHGPAGDRNATLRLIHQQGGSGNDTVAFVIYLASEGHQIRLIQTPAINGSPVELTTLSPRFTVLPGSPAGMRIIPDGGEVVNDTLRLSFRDRDVVLRAVVADSFGNPLGDYPSDWSSTGDPGVPTVSAFGRPLVVYSPSTAENNGVVTVCATSVDGTARDCIVIQITGVVMDPLEAITRDYSGCGYLDAIELRFPRALTMHESIEIGGRLDDKITVSYRGQRIFVDSVTINPTDPTRATLWLREDHTTDLQTGWTPALTIRADVFNEVAMTSSMTCTDGAAPVIASARLFFPSTNTGNVADNYIDVRFSEAVRTPAGHTFRDDQIRYNPAQLFSIWELSAQGERLGRRTPRGLARAAHAPNAGQVFDELVGHLDGIDAVQYIDDRTLRFYLQNGREIGPPRHYINIRVNPQADPRANVADAVAPRNFPDVNNRRVPITFGNEPNRVARPIPNPASPDRNGPGIDPSRPGVITPVHNPGAIPYIRGGGGGTVFQVPIYVPSSGNISVRLKVYDLAGNLVNSGESRDAVRGLESNRGEFVEIDLYWNGFNSRNMKVAPGTYRLVVHVTYTNTNDPMAKNPPPFRGTVGMSK